MYHHDRWAEVWNLRRGLVLPKHRKEDLFGSFGVVHGVTHSRCRCKDGIALDPNWAVRRTIGWSLRTVDELIKLSSAAFGDRDASLIASDEHRLARKQRIAKRRHVSDRRVILCVGLSPSRAATRTRRGTKGMWGTTVGMSMIKRDGPALVATLRGVLAGHVKIFRARNATKALPVAGPESFTE